MKVYFAGAPGLKSRERIWQNLAGRRLLSYWNIVQQEFNVPYAFKLIKRKNKNINENVGSKP